MNVQTVRLLIRGAATMLLLSSGLVVAWAFRTPVTIEKQPDFTAKQRSASVQTGLVGSPPLNEFAKFWRIELRRPLYDAPAPAPDANANRKDPAKRRRREAARNSGSLQLVGTMLEDGRSVAIFTDATGKVDYKGVGQSLDLLPGTRVDRIELTQVTISERGRSTVLQLPEPRTP